MTVLQRVGARFQICLNFKYKFILTVNMTNNNDNVGLYSAGIRHKWRSWGVLHVQPLEQNKQTIYSGGGL